MQNRKLSQCHPTVELTRRREFIQASPDQFVSTTRGSGWASLSRSRRSRPTICSMARSFAMADHEIDELANLKFAVTITVGINRVRKHDSVFLNGNLSWYVMHAEEVRLFRI